VFPSYIRSPETDAQMAKLVDALCSGRSVRKDVLVRIQFWAQRPRNLFAGIFIYRCELVRISGQNKKSGHASAWRGSLGKTTIQWIAERNPVMGT
jgi:hypothetical protein